MNTRKDRTHKNRELSVVISALNEEKTVQNVLKKVLSVFDKNKIDGEIIFMDNHCTDRTGELADQIAKKDERVRVIHRRNRKCRDLGSSLKEGFIYAKGKYILIMDCDLSHNPDDIPYLLEHKDEADIIIGSRYIKGGKADMPLHRWIVSGSYNFITKTLLGINVRDVTTGFKLYKSRVIKKLNLQSDGFGLHSEILIKALLNGYTAKEIPIFYKRTGKKSTLNYKKQFISYSKPLIIGLKEKYLKFLR
jgi:dolichol-phosphate mannosyltransferase